MTEERVFRSVTCLGCGCVCDDLEVRERDGRIVGLTPPCPVAGRWFGDGSVPAEIRVNGKAATVEQAIDAAASLLVGAPRPMVLLAPDLTTRAHRTAIAIADALGADVDGATSEAAASGLLAAQRRGRSGATLGEIRNRADVILFWAVDPRERYPRFLERYTMAQAGRLQYRLRPDQSGFANLFLAGDWTRNGAIVGCVEGAFMSGLMASRAICGNPATIPSEGGI